MLHILALLSIFYYNNQQQLKPSVTTLSHAEKFRLVQIVLQQLAAEEGIADQPANDFDPRQFFGLAHHTRQTVDDYLASAREGLEKFSTDRDTLGDAYEYLISQFAAGSGKKAGEDIYQAIDEINPIDPTTVTRQVMSCGKV